MAQINRLAIDVYTSSAKRIVSYLRKRKHVSSIEAALYHQDSTYTQIIVDTTWTEDMMDKWLYETSLPIEYVGVISLGHLDAEGELVKE